MKKVDILCEKMKKEMAGTKDIAAIAAKLSAKVDTSDVTFSGMNRSNIGREPEVVGKLFTAKKGELAGPYEGNMGAYLVYVTDITEAPAKEDYTFEKMRAMQEFNQRVSGAAYSALEKSAKVVDNRLKFY